MKKHLSAIFLAIVFLPTLSHAQLSLTHNRPRAGDKLTKYQVEFKDSCRSGKRVLWDFSQKKIVGKGHSVSYFSPRLRRDSLYVMGKDTFTIGHVGDSELLVARELYTQYFFRLKGGVLYATGYENPSDLMHHATPLPLIRYPVLYGSKEKIPIRSQCLYAQQVLLSTHGVYETEADAYGTIILPGGDTLKNTLRIHSVQTFLSDSLASMDSIRINTQIDTYQWYTPGYRYPVFETVRTVHSNNKVQDVFSVAFFYPPSGHLYLENDPENLALLEEIKQSANQNSGGNEGQSSTGSKALSIEGLLSCRIYPNPVETDLEVAYEVTAQANISIGMYSIEGFPIHVIPAKLHEPGSYSVTFNCSGLYPRNYVLRVLANDKVANGVVIKK